jgi:hypothetical protein
VLDGYAHQLAEDATLWSVDDLTTAELVRSACGALVDGLDSQALRELAGAGVASDFEIEDLLARVAADFGFQSFTRDSPAGRVAAARVLAGQCVGGNLTPREFARWMHARIRHGHEDRRLEALVSLDDVYDLAETSGQALEDIDLRVRLAAHELLTSP